MCTIYGAVGDFEEEKLQEIKSAGKLRGRDAEGSAGGFIQSPFTGKKPIRWFMGNLRACPTTELSNPTRLQPYDLVVHNGTIANDRELGNPEDAVDSEIIPKVIDRSSLSAFAKSLQKLHGSYALAVLGDKGFFLACNYKPLYYYFDGKATYFASLEDFLECVLLPGTRAVKLEPYSAVDLLTFEKVQLHRDINNKCLAIASAGLDSTVAAVQMQRLGYQVELLHFQYGCKAEPAEVDRITKIAEAMGTKVHFLPLGYSAMSGDSPLFKSEDVLAEGVAGAEYAHEWVPARNLVMLSLAAAFAEANGFCHICLGTNLEESGAYPDNEGEFINLFNQLLPNAVNEGGYLRVHQPVGHLMKHEIVKVGHDIGAPIGLTWSCYRNGEHHCGHCGPCFMRKMAHMRNGIIDPVFPQQGLKYGT